LEPDKDYHYFPLSLLSISAMLEKDGVECKIIDERVEENYEEQLMEEMKTTKYFCTTAFTGYQLSRAYAVSKKIKENFPESVVVWGGQHITNLPAQTLKSEVVDIGVVGYGEHIFKELMVKLFNGEKIEDVPGIVYRNDNGEVVVNEYPEKFEFENLPPLPYWLIDINKYINPATKRIMYISSYGCPGICTFCSTKNQKRWIPIPLERIKKDIEYLFDKHPFKELASFDATIFTVPKRLLDIAEIIKKYNFNWGVNARAVEINRLDEDFLRKLMDAGLEGVTVGLETGSTRVVDIMKKGKGHLEFFEKAAKKLDNVGLGITSGFIFGVPGETIEDLQESIAYAKKIKKVNKDFKLSSTFFRPLPGTGLYFELKNQGYSFPETLEEWAQSAEKTHFEYNKWMDIPWMNEKDKEEYKEIYTNFMEEEKELFV